MEEDEAGGKETRHSVIAINQDTHDEGLNQGAGGEDGEGMCLNWMSCS